MPITIRRAHIAEGSDDLVKVAKLDVALNKESFGNKCWFSAEGRVADWLLGQKNNGHPGLVLLAEEDKSPKGHVIYLMKENNVCFLSSLYVAKDFRGAGIGSKLLNCVVRDAKSRALSEVYVTPSKDSKPFYERNGFLVRENKPLVIMYLPLV